MKRKGVVLHGCLGVSGYVCGWSIKQTNGTKAKRGDTGEEMRILMSKDPDQRESTSEELLSFDFQTPAPVQKEEGEHTAQSRSMHLVLMLLFGLQMGSQWLGLR